MKTLNSKINKLKIDINLQETYDVNSQDIGIKNWTDVRLYVYPILLILLLLFTSAAFAQKTPPDPGKGATVAGFEVDADYFSHNIPSFWNAGNYDNFGTYGDDWSKGTSLNAVLKQVGGVSVPGLNTTTNAIWQVDGNWGNQSSVAEIKSFQGNSNKNDDDIRLSQKAYSLQDGGSGPQKNDITQSFLYSKTVNNHTWLFFAAETRATEGTSYLDFEVNQNGVTIANNRLYGPNNATPAGLNAIINGRTVNDIIIVVNYTGGGNKPIVGIRKWLASGQWSEELPLPAGAAYMTTNTANVAAVAPNKAFAGNGAYANITGALQLVEGALDVTALNIQLDACNPAGTVTVKTRSSASFTAELKDLDLLHFQLTPAASADLVAVASECQLPDSTLFHITGTYGNGTPILTATGGSAYIDNLVTNNGVITADIYVKGTGDSITKVLLTVASSNGACPSASDSIYLSISPKPSKPTVSIVNPDCSHKYGTITVTSPLNTTGNVLWQYRYNNGKWDTVHIFQFQGGDGYKIEVRAIADTSCISDAEECLGESISILNKPQKNNENKFKIQPLNNNTDQLGETHLKVYPNPFNYTSTIEFKVDNAGLAVLNVYDINGRLIKTLYNDKVPAGVMKQVTLDGSDLPNGLYFTRLMIDDKVVRSAKIILEK